MSGISDHDARNQRSSSVGISDHNRPESAITMVRNTQESTWVVEESLANIGATVMGRNMFGGHPGPWDAKKLWNGWWGGDPPFHHPAFVLTLATLGGAVGAAQTLTSAMGQLLIDAARMAFVSALQLTAVLGAASVLAASVLSARILAKAEASEREVNDESRA